MYIEFHLPQGAGGMAAGVALNHINIDIDNWIRKHNIQNYKTKLHKYNYRLCLATDADYSHFAISWDPTYSASRNFKFVNPK